MPDPEVTDLQARLREFMANYLGSPLPLPEQADFSMGVVEDLMEGWSTEQNTALLAEVKALRAELRKVEAEDTRKLVRLTVAESDLSQLRQQNRWIPIGEKLPELEEPVNVYSGAWKHVSTGCLADEVGDGEPEWYNGIDGIPDVTHWMPLPAPPEEE